MVHFEGLGFPFYGENEAELEETCQMMNHSFECMEVYLDLCGGGREECDEDCQHIIEDIQTFSDNTGLRNVQKELCDSRSAMRSAYLENYSCLEINANHYAACHNESQMSQEYMMNITENARATEERCCFFTWYHDCFTNITRDSCNENATFFVSFTLHNLLGHITFAMCGPTPDVCDRPPLPPISHDDIIPLDDGHKDVTEVDNSLDDEHKKVKDVDNSLDENFKSYAVYNTFSIWTLSATLMYIFISKQFS